MLAALDPHSSYLGPSDYEDMVERFRGDFEGGIYFEVRDGRLLVIAPIFGSPSHGKLRAGDHIAEIEGVSTLGISDEEVMDKLRGARGSLCAWGSPARGAKDCCTTNSPGSGNHSQRLCLYADSRRRLCAHGALW